MNLEILFQPGTYLQKGRSGWTIYRGNFNPVHRLRDFEFRKLGIRDCSKEIEIGSRTVLRVSRLLVKQNFR